MAGKGGAVGRRDVVPKRYRICARLPLPPAVCLCRPIGRHRTRSVFTQPPGTLPTLRCGEGAIAEIGKGGCHPLTPSAAPEYSRPGKMSDVVVMDRLTASLVEPLTDIHV
jgi:hypothetical protein